MTEPQQVGGRGGRRRRLVGLVHPGGRRRWSSSRRTGGRGSGGRWSRQGSRSNVGAGGPNLLLGARPARTPAAAPSSTATGFAFHSTLWDLDLDPGVAVAAPGWPDGTRAAADRPRPATSAGVGRAVQRGLRGPRDAAPARRGPDGGRQGRVPFADEDLAPARVGVGRARRVLRDRAEAAAGRRRRSRGPRSGRSVSGRSCQGRGLRAPAPALGRRATCGTSASRP